MSRIPERMVAAALAFATLVVVSTALAAVIPPLPLLEASVALCSG